MTQHSLPLTAHKGKQWVKVCCHDRAAGPGRGTVLQHTPARREQLVHKGDWLATWRNFRNRNTLKATYRMCFKCHRVHISQNSHFQFHECWPLFRVHPLMSKFLRTKLLQMAANLRKPQPLNPKHTLYQLCQTIGLIINFRLWCVLYPLCNWRRPFWGRNILLSEAVYIPRVLRSKKELS